MLLNKGSTDLTVEMGQATFPVIHMEIGHEMVNALFGYENEMEGSYLRDTLTPLPENRSLPIVIDKMGTRMKALSYEVRSLDMKRLVESTEVYNYVDQGDRIEAILNIKDLISPNTEYLLKIIFTTEEGKVIYFYTRIITETEIHGEENIEYVKNFGEKTFDKSEAKELVTYLESNELGDNSTFSKVTIHSSFNQITWGELNPKKETRTEIKIKEMNPSIATIETAYIVSIDNEHFKEYFQVREYYRLRYTKERIYLLDFQRSMDQYFNPMSIDSFANNKIVLGITNPNKKIEENSSGNVIVFEQEGILYWYQNDQGNLARLYGFYDKENNDIRTLRQEFSYKVISIDETGNTRFLVYGYMGRGRREGRVGVAVYYYDANVNTIEEEVFLPYTRSYQLLKHNIEKLSYVNSQNELYLLLDGTIFKVDLNQKKYSTVVSSLVEGKFVISDENTMIAWQKGRNVEVIDLNSGNKLDITAKEEEWIVPLGFMNEDIIYGIAKDEERQKENPGVLSSPMYMVCIEDRKGNILKTNKEEGIYITDAQINENAINLKRVRKDQDSGTYIPVQDAQIMNNVPEKMGKNKIHVAVSGDKEKIVQIALENNINKENLKLLTPKEILYEGGRELSLKSDTIMEEQYYVYGKDGLEGVYSEARLAVNAAMEKVGLAVGDDGRYIFARGDRKTRTRIQGIEEEEITEERNSLSVCLDVILKNEKVMRNSSSLLENGQDAISILQENLAADVLNLTGCSLEAVLYYVSKDYPVLAKDPEGNSVLIIGYDEKNTIVFEPFYGKINIKGMNDSIEWFQQAGNEFITYVMKD